MDFLNSLKELEWKFIGIFAIIGIILQDVLIEKVIPWLFLNNTMSQDYQHFMISIQFLIYLCLAFYLYRIVKDHKVIHIICLAILATLLSSVFRFIFYLISTQQLVNTFIFSIFNLGLILPLIFAGIIGLLSARTYSKLVDDKSTLFMKLCFPLAIIISMISIALLLYFHEPRITIPGFWPTLIVALNAAPYLMLSAVGYFFLAFSRLSLILVILGIPLFASHSPIETPLSYLWFFIIYYTIFLFFIGYSYMKFKTKNRFRWLLLAVALILFHLICSFIGFFALAFGT